MDDNLIAVTIFATVVTSALSLFGLLPTSRLQTLACGHVRLIHLLVLPLIVALICVYLDCVFPDGDDTDRLGYTIGCSLVAAIWWFNVARRTNSVTDPLAALYLTSTVLFGYLSPLMILFHTMLLFDNVRPAPPKTPLILGIVAHLALYMLVFLTTNWFARIDDREHDAGAPSRMQGAADSGFPNE